MYHLQVCFAGKTHRGRRRGKKGRERKRERKETTNEPHSNSLQRRQFVVRLKKRGLGGSSGWHRGATVPSGSRFFHLAAPPSLTCLSLSSCLLPHGLTLIAGPPRLTSTWVQEKVKSAHLYQEAKDKTFLAAMPNRPLLWCSWQVLGHAHCPFSPLSYHKNLDSFQKGNVAIKNIYMSPYLVKTNKQKQDDRQETHILI